MPDSLSDWKRQFFIKQLGYPVATEKSTADLEYEYYEKSLAGTVPGSVAQGTADGQTLI